MATLSENVEQAIKDFDDIKDAIIEQGVEVADATPTSEYGDKVRQIEGTAPSANLDDFIAGRMEEVTTELNIIPDFAFSGKSHLHTVYAENATFIGKYAFSSAASYSSSSSSGSEDGDGGDEEPVGFTNKYLEHVYMPNVTTIDSSAFQYDESLELDELPNSLAVIMDRAFQGCSKVHISKLPDAAIYIGNRALDTGYIFVLPRFPQNIETLEYQPTIVYTYVDWSTLPASAKQIYLPNNSDVRQSLISFLSQYTTTAPGSSWQVLELDRIPAQWFSVNLEGCNNIFSQWCLYGTIEIPEHVTALRNEVFRDLRYGPGFLHLTIPTTVQSIGRYAFSNCDPLTTLHFAASIAEIPDSMCYNCPSLIAVTITDNVSSIGPGAFQSCSTLTTAQLPEGLEYIRGSAFRNCSNLNIPEFPSTLIRIDNSAFNNSGKTSTITGTLTIPNSVTVIDSDAFSNSYYYVDKLIIGNSVQAIANYAFRYFGQYATYLRIVLGQNVQMIQSYAFEGTYAKRVYIPISTVSISDYAFGNCPDIVVYYQGDESQWNQVYKHVYSGLDGKTIHYNSSPEDVDVDIPTNEVEK